MNKKILNLGLWLSLGCGWVAAGGVTVGSLRCEYLENPLGIDATAPRLSWKLEAGTEARGIKQTAYQVLVASSADALKKDQGDLWDSGKVTADQDNQVAYAGQPLASRTRCAWKVKVWTSEAAAAKEVASGWSAPASWEMGLLKPEDWSASWIETVRGPAPKKPAGPAPALTIVKATYGADGGGKDVTALLAGMVKDNSLAITVSNENMGGDPAFGKVKQLKVEYRSGDKSLRTSVGEKTRLEIPGGGADSTARLSYLRKSFKLAKPVASARLYATALGLFEFHLNGKRVGDAMLAPEWTDYRKRVRYQVYDITPLLTNGDNVLAAMLGHGWYSGHVAWMNQVYGKVPALLSQLEVFYQDGSSERIATDESWKCHDSPILASDMLMGEAYDARLEVPGWDKPETGDNDWPAAKSRQESARSLDAQVNAPVRKICELPAKSLTEPKPGCWVFDLGQNMVGYVNLKIVAPTGTEVTLRHAEMLNPDGSIYTTNLRKAKATDTYTCKGGGTETWHPFFTFHGFRYVEVTGLPAKPSLDLVTGIVLASDNPQVGQFACSDARVNQLYSNIVWGQRGNYLSVPTDCPQRDERLGWMGDAQVFVKTASMNADIAAFFTKWLVDVDDVQHPDGAFTDVSPVVMGGGVPAWADAGVICPWTIHLAYGDNRVLEKHLPAMTKWVEWCRVHSTDLVRNKDRGSDYGDWLSISADTPKDVIGTAYFAYSTRLVAQSYKALGKTEEAAKYEQLFQDIKAAFNKAFVGADGRIKGNTQCVYIMALKFDLLPDEIKAKAAQYLEDDIKAKGWHLSTGFVGVSYLLPVLTEAGKINTAYRLLLQDTFPSWLFSVKHGATTIWERWDGWTPERGFQDPGMNSFNHYSLGSCGEWLFQSVAGIAPDAEMPGYRHVVCHPHPGDGLTSVKASYHSTQGLIASDWKTDGGKFTWNLVIPANTVATMHVPATDQASVTESGKPAAQSAGLKFLRMADGAAVFEAGSGSYRFQSALPGGAQ